MAYITPTKPQWSSSTATDVNLNVVGQEVLEATSGGRGEGLASWLSLAVNLHTALILQPVMYPPKVLGPFEDPAHTIFSHE